MKLNFIPIVICGLTLSCTSVHANNEFEVLYHEPLGDLSLGEYSGNIAFSQKDRRLSFFAFAKQFEIVLETNDRMVAALPARQRRNHGVTYQAYRGHLEGIEDSWIRLTQVGKTFSGVVWDGERLYAIEPYADMENLLPRGMQYSKTEHIMFEATDMLALSGNICGLQHANSNTAEGDQFSQLVKELQQVAAAQAGQQLNIAMVADAQFSAQNAGNVNAAVITRLNIVDGIFSEQVGVKINVSNIRQLNNNGTLNSTDPRTLLDQLSNFSSSQQIDNPGLVHMLTGRDLNGGVIGIAFLSAICNNTFGVGITQSDGSSSATFAALIAAHEIGHNFGSPHDNQGGSACVNTPGDFLMNPFINGSDRFSQCSLEQIQPVVNRAACLVQIDDPGDPNPPEETLFSSDFNDGTAQGFGLRRGAFRSTNNAFYERAFISNNSGFTGGALQVLLGGRDNTDVLGMSAGVFRTFSLATSRQVRISFRFNLIQSGDYEGDEFSEAMASLDGNLLARNGNAILARVDGNGNGGPSQSTGYIAVEFDLGLLSAGTHELIIGGFNNKKTFNNESTQILVDDVVVRAQ